MDEATVLLTSNECKFLLGMLDWAWSEGGLRSEQQAMLAFSAKAKIISAMKDKKREVSPAEGKSGDPA